QALVDEQLVVVQIEVGVDLVALEQVVADRGLAEEIALAQRRLLSMAREREEQLGLERGAGAPGVEVGEERVVPLFDHHRRIEPRAEAIGQRRLADAGRALYRDVAKLRHLSGSIE